jgi:cytosine/adenosine deaminase-related metal-dependent hydrolase
MLITAPQIHNGHRFLPARSTIAINDDGFIENILAVPTADTIHYDGILAPGFVNAHCHLELSHTKGMIPEHTGLITFLKNVSLHRDDFSSEQKELARAGAYNELVNNGVVAVGDIANSTDTLNLRALDKLHMHTFVEALGFTEANAEKSFGYAHSTYASFAAQPVNNKTLGQSITPHAPYSVSSSLFKLIDSFDNNSILSIHNQESGPENEFFKRKEGGVLDLLNALGIDDTPFSPTGKSSLQSYLEWLSYERNYIFVHNTYSEPGDIAFVKKHIQQAFWCLCPNANLYIENKLPDIDMLVNEGATICIGTDSLASNHQLCVLSELQTINEHYPNIGWETLLKWATLNGARALQMDSFLGSIEIGKKPGIIHIQHLDTPASKPEVRMLRP